jgi:copper chaperone CopZ
MHCVHAIKTEVGDLVGVTNVSADLEKKQATITFGPPADEEKIKSLLAEINYPVAA